MLLPFDLNFSDLIDFNLSRVVAPWLIRKKTFFYVLPRFFLTFIQHDIHIHVD